MGRQRSIGSISPSLTARCGTAKRKQSYRIMHEFRGRESSKVICRAKTEQPQLLFCAPAGAESQYWPSHASLSTMCAWSAPSSGLGREGSDRAPRIVFKKRARGPRMQPGGHAACVRAQSALRQEQHLNTLAQELYCKHASIPVQMFNKHFVKTCCKNVLSNYVYKTAFTKENLHERID